MQVSNSSIPLSPVPLSVGQPPTKMQKISSLALDILKNKDMWKSFGFSAFGIVAIVCSASASPVVSTAGFLGLIGFIGTFFALRVKRGGGNTLSRTEEEEIKKTHIDILNEFVKNWENKRNLLDTVHKMLAKERKEVNVSTPIQTCHLKNFLFGKLEENQDFISDLPDFKRYFSALIDTCYSNSKNETAFLDSLLEVVRGRKRLLEAIINSLKQFQSNAKTDSGRRVRGMVRGLAKDLLPQNFCWEPSPS